MSPVAQIYRAEILRAVLGPNANMLKASDIGRLNRIAEHLAACEEAQAILRRKGYGRASMTFVEVVCSVPENVCGLLRNLFRPAGTRMPEARSDLNEALDIWTSR